MTDPTRFVPLTPTLAEIASAPYAGGSINGPTTYESARRVPLAKRAAALAERYVRYREAGDNLNLLVWLDMERATPGLVAAAYLGVLDMRGSEFAAGFMRWCVEAETADPIWWAADSDLAEAYGSTMASDRAAGIARSASTN